MTSESSNFEEARKLAERGGANLEAEQLAKIASQVPGVIYQYRLYPDGRSCFPYASGEMKNIYGVDPDEVKDDAASVFNAIHPDDLKRVVESIQTSARDLTPWRCEYRTRFKDDSIRWLYGNSVPERLPDNSVLWHGFITSIDERKDSEQKITEANRFIKMVTDGIPGLIAYWTKDLRCTFANQRFLEWYGRSADEMLGIQMQDFLGRDLFQKTERCIKSVLAGQSESFESIITKQSGDVRYVLTQYAPDINSGEIRGFFVFVSDVTQLKQAEQALRASEQQFASTFEYAAIGMALVSPEGRPLKVNRALCSILGYSEKELLAQSVQALTHPDDLEHDWANRTQLLKGKIPTYSIEKRYFHKAGHTVWGLLNVSLVRDCNGKPLHLITEIQDISERKQAEESIKRLALQMKQLLESAGEGIYGIDTEGRCTFINRVGAEMLGYTTKQIVGRDMHELIHYQRENGSPYLKEDSPILTAMKKGERCRVESEVFWCADGTSFPVEYSSYPVLEQNIITGAVITFSDITQRKQAAIQIAEQAALLDNAHDAILVRDLEGCITFWNKGAERLYGWTRQEALGRKVNELIWKDKAKFSEAQDLVVEKGEWYGEAINLSKDAGDVVVEARWTLLRDRRGAPKSVLAINTDITERKKIEAQFLRAQRMESIGTMAGGIAHDLNNILSPIVMSIELLKATNENPQTHKLIETLENNARRGTDLLRQILSFARGLDGQRIEIKPIDLINEVELFIKDTFPKRIRIQVSVGKNIGVVEGDSTQLHQVLLNLCVNARDAILESGTLHLSLENIVLDHDSLELGFQAKAGRYVMISVGDTGMGIPRELVDKIFEPFFTTKPFGKGTGLGLSTVMAIVKSHGGFLKVDSEPNRGTLFRIYLPAKEAAIAPVENSVTNNHLARGNNETVLLVDDEASILEVMSETLMVFGYKTLTARDGAQAISLYEKNRAQIDIVVTDLMMPEMDGAALISILRSMNPQLKIIATSGLNDALFATSKKEEQPDFFLPKPYSAKNLLETLRNALNGKVKDDEPTPAIRVG